jgi:anti-sigma regulatory factor (Ser/Thr protein kinase)
MPNRSSISQAEAATEIRIVNEISEIARVADMVDAFGAQHELSNSVIVALNVSLDEIINNIISYGYDDSARHDITIRLKIGNGMVEAVVEDDSRPFDPLAIATPRPKSPTEVGGVGLHFVKNLMDHLEYSRSDGMNRLRMVKKLEH